MKFLKTLFNFLFYPIILMVNPKWVISREYKEAYGVNAEKEKRDDTGNENRDEELKKDPTPK